MGENPHVIAAVEGSNIVVKDCLEERTCKLMEEHGSLSEGILEPLEAAYQAVKGKVAVDGETGWSAALRIAKDIIGDLDLFLVYYDLRRRGRRVRRGVRRRTLIVTYTPSRRVEILVLSEGRRIRLSEIFEWSRLAAADGHEPVIAVVDSYGRATYYEARAAREIV